MHKLNINHPLKKLWEKPILVRLVKGQFEERVLVTCKTILTGVAPDDENGMCTVVRTCVACDVVSSS